MAFKHSLKSSAWIMRARPRMFRSRPIPLWLMPLCLAAMVAACGPAAGSSGGGAAPTDSIQSAPATKTSYVYDAANRLLSAAVSTDSSSSPKAQFVYGYDAASNLVSMTEGEATRTLAATATNSLASAVYDSQGNLTALDGTTYTWDSQDRLLSIATGDERSDFTYDGLGRLVRIVDSRAGAVVSDKAYTWCGDTRCLEHDNLRGGSPISKRYFDEGVEIDGAPYYYVADRLGSVRQLVDASGQVRAQYEYDPYGRRLKTSGDLESDIGYGGYFHHAGSGLDLAMLRAYDPAHGRWLNRDPIEEEGGLNLHGYALGNPVLWSDPSGLDVLKYVPVAGNLREAWRNGECGHYGWAAFYAVMGVSDVFLVKAAAVTVVKLVVAKGGVALAGKFLMAMAAAPRNAAKGGGSVALFHGTSDKSVPSILEGLRAVSTNTAPFPAGSFFTTMGKDAQLAASHWAARSAELYGGSPAVLRGTISQRLFDRLSGQGLIRTGSVPGLPFFPPQTVILPGALPAVSAEIKWSVVPLTF